MNIPEALENAKSLQDIGIKYITAIKTVLTGQEGFLVTEKTPGRLEILFLGVKIITRVEYKIQLFQGSVVSYLADEDGKISPASLLLVEGFDSLGNICYKNFPSRIQDAARDYPKKIVQAFLEGDFTLCL